MKRKIKELLDRIPNEPEKIPAAVALGRLRWKRKTDAEKSEHGKAMAGKRWGTR